MDDYAYRELEMNCGIMWEIISREFANKRFSRQDAIQYAVEYHKSHGGLCEKESYVSAFKGMVKIHHNEFEKISYGIWQLAKDDGKPIDVVIRKQEKTNIEADKTIGSGKEFVYVYYYDTYKEINELKGNMVFPCKVGMSKCMDVYERIAGQSTTAFPESPHLSLVIKCDDSRAAERMLHSVLKFRKRQILDSPGMEWFMTSPKEIEEIYLTLSNEVQIC